MADVNMADADDFLRRVANGEDPNIVFANPAPQRQINVPIPAPAPPPGIGQGGGRRNGGPAIRQGLIPVRSRAYQYVYRAHHGASKGLTAKQIRHLYRYRPKKRVSAATRERIRKMGAINGPALKAAKAIAKAEGRKMTKQDFYNAGGTRPKVPAGGA